MQFTFILKVAPTEKYIYLFCFSVMAKYKPPDH